VQRKAEEFLHQLPNGRRFVGDFVRTDRDGQEVFLLERRPGGGVVDMRLSTIARDACDIRTYAAKSSAKRAAQRMIERVLNEDL
jgi:hypothetical protein